MSLTPEAYRERKWGRYPALRKALEDKEIPSRYYGFTSVSDNMFDATLRLMEIAVLAIEYGSAIREMVPLVGREKMYSDLRALEKSLKSASQSFAEDSDKVRRLYETL